MKRKIYFFIVFLVLSIPLLANSKDSTIVGPGVIHYHEFREAGPWHFNVLVIDLTNPLLKIETVKADDLLRGSAFERTSSMASRNHYEGHQVVGAINGDFYNTSTGEPISTQVVNGEILKNTNTRLNFATNIYNKPMIDVVTFSGKIFLDDTLLTTISDINAERFTDQLIYYNSYKGSSTGTDSNGIEIKFSPINQWIMNDTMLCVVEAKQVNVGGMSLSKGKGVFSGHGINATALNYIQVGDTIKVYMGLTPALEKLDQLVGGGPVIIQHGVNIGSSADVHPRTAIGFNQDSTKLFLFTVDGRQTGYSVGMSFYQLAAYMLEWDVYEGLNLDGGGSTTMVVRGEVVNSPSDGTERSVSNCLLVVCETFTDTLSQLRISPDPVYVIEGGTVPFEVEGFDQYYNPVSVNPDSVFWSCDTFLGSITQDGLFTAKDDTLIGYVYAEVNSIKDSALVYMTQIANITLQPTPIILQVGQNQVITPTARDSYDNIINLAITDYNWTCTDSIGTVSTSGNFYATALGSGFVYAEYDSVFGSVPVSIGVSEYVIIDDFSDVSKYNLTGVFVDLINCSLTVDSTVFVSPTSSGKLKYKFVTGGITCLYMNCDIPISGTPDKVGINVYGDGHSHWLRGEFWDVDGEKFILDFTSATPGIDWNNSWQFVENLISSATPKWGMPPGATVTFPITWKIIYLAETNDTKKDTGSICLDDFKVHFIATDIQTEDGQIPEKFELNQNYPNPFNPSTIISYSLPEKSFVKIKIYDTLGREVINLVNEEKPAGIHQVEFKGYNLASGVYLYRIEAGNYSETKKMILLK